MKTREDGLMPPGRRLAAERAHEEFVKWFMENLGSALAKSGALESNPREIETMKHMPIKTSMEERTRKACAQLTSVMVYLAHTLDYRRGIDPAKCDRCDAVGNAVARTGADRWLCERHTPPRWHVFGPSEGLGHLRSILYEMDLLDSKWWGGLGDSPGIYFKRGWADFESQGLNCEELEDPNIPTSYDVLRAAGIDPNS